MARDTSNQSTQRPDWEALPKSGVGSEFGREAKEMARRRKYGFMPKRHSVEDFPWIITTKTTDKFSKTKEKERQYIGKKSVSENSSYFVFIKCADGGFEAYPLEDWYSFAPHKTYQTLNHEEAEEAYKRRHKTVNKHLIMLNKRKNQGDVDDEEVDGVTSGSNIKPAPKAFRDNSDEDEAKKRKNKNYKSSNLSDDDEEDVKNKRGKAPVEKKKPAAKKKFDEYASGEEYNDKEDSDDGDREGMEKDYSSSDSASESEPETSKFEEKYQEKGIDEEIVVKALDKSDDEEEEEDEGLTEEGKEYRKLMNKDKNEGDEFDEFFRTGTIKNEEDSKDSVSTFDESDLDGEFDVNKEN